MSEPQNAPVASGESGDADPTSGAESRRGLGRALGLTLLGTLLPGAGLTQTRRRRLGWALLALAVALGAFVAWRVASRGATRAALSLATDPGSLRAVAVVAVVGGALWCGSIILTAVLTRPTGPDRGPKVVLSLVATVLVLAVGVVSFTAAQYATITRDTVNEVFLPTVPTPGVTQPGPVVAQGDDPWADTPRVNILLLGSDAGVGRTGTRTDSMIVASIDTKSGRTALISLPRNLERAPLPKKSPLREVYPSGIYGRPTCFSGPNECLLNAIWTEADQFRANHPESYPGVASPGRDEIRDVISEVTGLKIDNTVVIDLKGFQQLVDAMGGVEVNVKLSGYGAKLPIGGHINESTGVLEGVTGYFETGRQRLDGFHALWYARTRAGDDDFFRQDRQRCVVKALVEQVNPTTMLARYPQLARIAKDNIFTDVPAAHLSAFVELVERIKDAEITSVGLSPKTGVSSANPDYDLIRDLVRQGINPPKAKPSSSSSTPTPTKKATSPTRSPTPSPTATPYADC
ncbi:transcriptional regulator [Humibacillus sp. DSM 29435]|uniref:LCP family protein n=1 Tax=Humibacillus sp. DSM 29435 TaxID=1869167 RepID=UPI0008723506|nr:LCP family protein [Humibacillus sp. DSM 29435]OFE16110.1 transcriptional regulator [Humibacillus sp. DSM 29435]